MIYEKIMKALEYSNGYSVYELIEKHNIELHEVALNSAYGVILISNDKSIIYIDNSLEWQRKEFVLWHELGHYLLEEKCGKYYFMKNGKSELKSNVYACMMLGGNVDDWIKRGCPKKVANDVYDYISQNVYVRTTLSDVYF